MDAHGVMQTPTQRYGTETCGHCDYIFHPSHVHLHPSDALSACFSNTIIASPSISDPQSAEMQPVGLYCLFIFMYFMLLYPILFLAWLKIEPGDSCMSSTCFINKLCPGMHFFTKHKMADMDGTSLLDSEISVLFCSSLYFFLQLSTVILEQQLSAFKGTRSN